MLSLSICLGLLAVLLVTHAVAARAGARFARSHDQAELPKLGAINGALLGLLGLLLAFCFSEASHRFFDRQDMIVREANALGTAWLRAAAAPEPQRDALRALLADYADTRIALAETSFAMEKISAAEQKSAALHAPIWQAGLAAAGKDPALVLLILPSLNDVIDMHATRADATRRHHRLPVLVVLGLASLVALSLLGFEAGFTDRRQTFHAAFAVIVASVLWLNLDLDFVRIGLIGVDASPLIDARAAMLAP